MKPRKYVTRRNTKALLLFEFAVASLIFIPRASLAAQLSSKTAHAFDNYIVAKERMVDDFAAKKHFLYIDTFAGPQRAEAYAKLRAGEVLVQRDPGCVNRACTKPAGGLIHDWIGIVFVPSISLSQALATLQDYDRDAALYPAEVVGSKLVSHSGDNFHIYLRLRQIHIITVVLDTEYDVHYEGIDSTHACARSHSTRIAEVDHPGAPDEREEAVGNDHGFLWRLDSYWRFHQTDGGVYVQVEAVSLTRDVPAGLGWLIGSFIESIPESSLRSTLAETRSGLLAQLNLAKEKSQ